MTTIDRFEHTTLEPYSLELHEAAIVANAIYTKRATQKLLDKTIHALSMVPVETQVTAAAYLKPSK